MLSIKLSTSTFSILTVIILFCTLSVSKIRAENYDGFRHEPILPIPQKVEVDIKKANIGEMLFFDKRLSKNNQLSCASCHQLGTGGDDNVATGISMSADQRLVNTPSIFNALYNFRQNWDGSITTLEQQIDSVIINQHEFNNSWHSIISSLATDEKFKYYFKTVYTDGITKNNIINAIVEFEKTLITPNSRFDKYLRNEDENLTKKEIKGYLVFKELGCISCHQGINIGGNLYQKFGVFYNYIAERGDIKKPDYGRSNVSHRQIDTFVFKVPSLRNVAVTAPYLHDGSAATIDEAIIIMGRTQLGRNLTTEEVELIHSFLNTLTGEYKNKSLDSQS